VICDNPCADRVVVLNAIIPSKVKALLILVTSLHFPNLSFSCMIDCGSSHCFIDSHYTKVDHFLIVSVPQMRLCLIDGFSLSYIMHATDISVWFPCGTTHQVRILITKLDTKFSAVLRLDWLNLHNPLINWADSSVTFREHPNILLVTTTQSVLANQEELPSNDDASSKLSEDLSDPNPVNIPEPATKFISNPTVDSILVPNTIPTSNPILNNSSTSPIPLISLVSAEAFMRSMQSEGAQCFSILAHEPLKPDSPDKLKLNPDLKDVPEVYYEFADVFSRQKADTLLPHWDCDLKININEGAKIPAGPIYPLSKFELKTLREFIDENLKTGFIHPSNSLFGASFFLSRKRTDLSGYVLISDGLTLSIEKTSILCH
jgi:hypothetical protein